MAIEERKRLQEPIHYPEANVRFSMSQCDVGKYCIQKLEKEELRALYRRFGHLEQMTWQQAALVSRDKGISIDKAGSRVRAMLERIAPGISTFGHFRVTGIDANTRVFIGRDRDLARVYLIDRTGELQH